ncbi:MAG: TetR family transcriptional regulator [Microthrixaceae bacterium]
MPTPPEIDTADSTDSAGGSTATPTRRERKKLATREALRAAALELFTDRGFESVTVEEICVRADVASSTFFRHFATKEAVVLADYDERGRQLLEALDAQPEGVGAADLLIGAIVQWSETRRPAEVLKAEATLLAGEPALQLHLDRVITGWEVPIAARLAERYGRDAGSLELHLDAAWFVTSIRVVIREWALSGGDEDVYAVGARAVQRLAPLLEGRDTA